MVKNMRLEDLLFELTCARIFDREIPYKEKLSEFYKKLNIKENPRGVELYFNGRKFGEISLKNILNYLGSGRFGEFIGGLWGAAGGMGLMGYLAGSVEIPIYVKLPMLLLAGIIGLIVGSRIGRKVARIIGGGKIRVTDRETYKEVKREYEKIKHLI